jgi:hypothetical protein
MNKWICFVAIALLDSCIANPDWVAAGVGLADTDGMPDATCADGSMGCGQCMAYCSCDCCDCSGCQCKNCEACNANPPSPPYPPSPSPSPYDDDDDTIYKFWNWAGFKLRMRLCYSTELGIDSGKGIEACAIPYSIGLVTLLLFGGAIYICCRNRRQSQRAATGIYMNGAGGSSVSSTRPLLQ